MVTFTETPPAITEERLTRLVAEFANTGELTGVLLRIPGVRLLVAIDRNGRVIPGEVHGHAPTKDLSDSQKQLCTDLVAILHDELDGRNLRRLTVTANKMKITPKYQVDSEGKLAAVYHYDPEGPAAAIAYGTLLIADTARPFRRDLKRCRLESCGRFFFSSDSPALSGRDRTKFCSPEHLQLHHQSTSAERVRKWRKDKAKEAAKKAGNNR